jgi:hypothetical protein
VDGFGNTGLDDDSFTVIIGGDEEVTVEPSPPTLSAQLIDREEEKRRDVQDFLQNAVVADVIPNVAPDNVVPNVAPDNSSRRWKFACVFVVLILIVIGVALGIKFLRPDPTAAPTNSPTAAPTLSPEAFLSDLLLPISSDKGKALLTNSTPQNKAFNWMATNNTNLGALSNETIIQRYALATLYYGANGDSWNINESWLSESEECGIWKTADGSLGCTGTDAVSELDLYSNTLQGTLPPEIGLLTSLGECVTHDRLPQRARSVTVGIHSYPPRDSNGLFGLFVQLL